MKRNKKSDVSAEQNKDDLVDKAFNRSVLLAVVSILLCLACLTATTWAWFQRDINSATNTIQTQPYMLTASIKDENGARVTFDEISVGHYEGAFQPDQTYTVELTAEGTGKNGYCKLIVEDQQDMTFYTNLVTILDPSEPTVASFQFKLTDTDASTHKVCLDLRWGTYSGTPQIMPDGGEYVISMTDRSISRVAELTEGEDQA